MVYTSIGSNIWADGICAVDNNTAGIHLEIVTTHNGVDHNAVHMIHVTYQV